MLVATSGLETSTLIWTMKRRGKRYGVLLLLVGQLDLVFQFGIHRMQTECRLIMHCWRMAHDGRRIYALLLTARLGIISVVANGFKGSMPRFRENSHAVQNIISVVHPLSLMAVTVVLL